MRDESDVDGEPLDTPLPACINVPFQSQGTSLSRLLRRILAQFTNAAAPLHDPSSRCIVLCNHYHHSFSLLSSMNFLPHRPLRSYIFRVCCPAIRDILRYLCSNTRSSYEFLKLLDFVTCVETWIFIFFIRLKRRLLYLSTRNCLH